MTDLRVPAPTPQGLSTDKFLYFFMGLRKGEIQRRVEMLRKRYPDDPPEALARRVIAAERPLALLGGALSSI